MASSRVTCSPGWTPIPCGDGLELLILLPLYSTQYGYRCAKAHLVYAMLGTEPRTLSARQALYRLSDFLSPDNLFFLEEPALLTSVTICVFVCLFVFETGSYYAGLLAGLEPTV